MCPPLHRGGGATAHRHHRNPAEAWRRWRGRGEGANQGQALLSACTLRSKEKSSANPGLLPAWARQSQCSPTRRSCSAQDQGSARASAVMVRPAGAVPSRRPETIRGERNASGSQQPDVPLDLAFAPGKHGEAADPAIGQLVDPAAGLGNRHQQGCRDATASSACCARAHG